MTTENTKSAPDLSEAEASPQSQAENSTPPPADDGQPHGFVQRFLVLKGAIRELWSIFACKIMAIVAYGLCNSTIILWLSKDLGWSDVEAGTIVAFWSTILTLITVMVGSLVDAIGIKKALIIGFVICVFSRLVMSLTTNNAIVLPLGLMPLAVGEALLVPVMVAAIKLYTTAAQRSMAFSIFYAMVNIGAFSGKTIVKPLREALGNEGFITLNYFSATMTFLALLAIWFLYKSDQHSGEGKSFGQIWHALIKVCTNGRLITLIIIITGFWMVQHQLYATMPKYVLRLAGEDASPSWYANVNPLVVVLTVNLVTQLMKKRTALTSMTVGMFIMPISALCMAYGNQLDPDVALLGMHPVAFMMVVGIVFQGLAETFISPRFLEYFSLQAPKGEEGLYLGFSHLHSFLSSILGFGLSGFLLSAYCPEPALFESREAWRAASAHAHYIWYYFGAIALISAFALIIYGQVVKRLDAKREAAQ